ncbi:MAG: alanine:cation symporter family protein, partial [Bacteroidales bacterium]|nr:alanine:cation symporter family protein [Bacteroidales bacterium]
DMLVLSMAVPNLIGLYLLAPELKRDVKAYQKARNK